MLLSGLQVFFIVNTIKKILGDFARLCCLSIGDFPVDTDRDLIYDCTKSLKKGEK